MAEENITLEVFRYRPDQETEPTFQSYSVPYRKHWMVLDALNYIKDTQDGTLSYRWSCRMGVCGSCGMMVNGVPKLTCAAFLRDYYPSPIRVEPLDNFPVERDLVVTLDDFMQKLARIKPYIVHPEGQPRPQTASVAAPVKDLVQEGEYLQSPAEREQYAQFSMCINCMLCYAACPVYGLEPEFIGPAAIALAQRYNHDSRDRGRQQRFDEIFTHEGVWACTFVGECTEVCPKHVDPAGAIQQAKIEGALDFFKRIFLPGRSK